MTRPILFFKAGGFSHVNENVVGVLKREFPGAQLRVIDVVSDILKRHPAAALRALVDVARIYPREIILKRREPTDFILRTPAAFRAIKDWVGKNVRVGDADFTFQTQSLFDASTPGIPHFLYTDHTCLANRRNSIPVSAEFFDPRWIAMEKTAYESARLTFTTSNFARDSLVEDYVMPPERVVCAFSGTNANPARPAALARSIGGKIILFIGIDWVRKGGPDLLKAFDLVAANHPEALLHIVGCSPAVRHPRVRTFGQLPLDKVADQLAGADVFCLPSYFEPSPVAVVEAMHHGLPTVGTRVGGMSDRIIDGETGWLVEAGDIPGLARSLSALLDDPAQRSSMGEAGRLLAGKEFTWEATGRRLAAGIRMACS